MKHSILFPFSFLLFTCFVTCFAAAPRNVFVFIGDGMSVPQRNVAESFSRAMGAGDLAMNHLPHRTITQTGSANAVVTDSAAAATAIACGEKTKNGMIGVSRDGTNRLVSVAEVAKRRGMRVGIATTVTIVHATPAGFYAHNKSRGEAYQIALDLVDSNFDYFCGGGVYNKWDEKKNKKYKGDVFELAKAAGYVVTRDDLAAWRALKPGQKAWSVFGDNGMDFAIDANPNQPTPAQIVEKGIELLENDNGFFFMFEGGRVDYAGHANDAATNLRDIIMLDEAVKVALRYQAKHPDTLVITTGDHETGGLSMGFAGTGSKFDVKALAGQKVSTELFSGQIKKLISDRKGEIAFDEVKPIIAEKFGLANLSAKEEANLKKAFEQDIANVQKKLKDTTAHDVARKYVFAQAVKNALGARAGVAWSSGGHTALPTLTTAQGCCADIVDGMTENSDIGARLKMLLSAK